MVSRRRQDRSREGAAATLARFWHFGDNRDFSRSRNRVMSL